MTKKSGLADSPFFKPVTPVQEVYSSPEVLPPLPDVNNSLATVIPSASQSQDGQKARLQASKIARTPPSKNMAFLSSKNARMQDFIGTLLALKNTKNTNFRYPPELLEKIDDLEYEVKKRTGKKLKTTDVLVCAVGYLIWDYEQHGTDSILERNLVQSEL
ncbi:MAG: hypothetical protein K8L91_15770 [Anaerolineae bacterium]|nr:hypothetical protein [Anaerolineae bacterium]